jgi:fatty acid desaturase
MLIAFILIIIHYIADFMFQTENQALGKSKSYSKLISHTFTYTVVFFVLLILIGFGVNLVMGYKYIFISLWFFLITFITHTVIDYVTSKITSKKFEKKEFYTGIPNFGAFSIIGLDQVAHYATLFATYYLLTN